MHKKIDFSILRLINRHLNYLLFRFLPLGCQSNLNQQCVDYNNCVILRMFAFHPQVKKLLRRWQLCIELTLGTTCRCFLAATFVVSKPFAQERAFKRWREGRKQPLSISAPEFSKLHLTTLWQQESLGGNNCWLSEHVFLHFFPAGDDWQHSPPTPHCFGT